MGEFSASSALAGVLVGWALKTLADLLSWVVKERRQFRRATFSLLRTYLVIADYDRSTTYFQRSRPTVEIFEATRATIAEAMLDRMKSLEDGLGEAVALVGSLSPTKALELDRALIRVPRTVTGMLQVTARDNAPAYGDLLARSDEVVATALLSLQESTRATALRAGLLPWLKVRWWFWNHHGGGQRRFDEGMESQRPIREQTAGLGTQAYADRFWSAFGQEEQQATEK